MDATINDSSEHHLPTVDPMKEERSEVLHVFKIWAAQCDKIPFGKLSCAFSLPESFLEIFRSRKDRPAPYVHMSKSIRHSISFYHVN